jgi:glycosyltransferase involved in cell wall biosynthesis
VKDKIRLAVDARDLASDTRGIGRYARAILRRLVRRDDIELTLLVRGPFASRRRKALQTTLGSERFRVASSASGCDVIWHPANGTFFTSRASGVVTIHDTVPFRFPDPDAKRRAHQQAPFLRSVETASRFIAVSEFDRHELIDVFRMPPERIEVIYHGADPFFSPANGSDSQSNQRAPYLLFVGDPVAEPRKNFPMLLDAYRRAFTGADAPRLVVVGARDPRIPGVDYAGHAGGDATGEGDTVLRSLYRNALALCIPSYYETFGMPMVESMACGTPVIASNASCLPEIGGDAAHYAPPHDPQIWAQSLQEIVHDPALRARLRATGLARAARYTWDESARRHAEVFFNL